MKTEIVITPEIVKEHGLTPDEYDKSPGNSRQGTDYYRTGNFSR